MQPTRIERVTEVIEYASESPLGQVDRYATRDAQPEPVKRSFRETRSGYSKSPLKAAEAADYGSKDRTYVIGYGSPLNTSKRYENEVVHRSITKENRQYDHEGSVHSGTQNSAKRFEGTYSKSPLRKDGVESRLGNTQYSGRREPEREVQPKVTRYYEEVVERRVPVDQRSEAESFDRREHHQPLRIEDESEYKPRYHDPAPVRPQQPQARYSKYQDEREPEEREPARTKYAPIPIRREELVYSTEETRVSGRRTPTKDSASKVPVYEANGHQDSRRPATPDRGLARSSQVRPSPNLGGTRTITERISPNNRTIEERVVEYDTRPPREIEDELTKVRNRIEEIKRRTQELEDVRGQLSETEFRLEETYKRATQHPTDLKQRTAEKPVDRLGKTEVFYEGDTRVERTVYPSPKKEYQNPQPLGVDRFPAKSSHFDSPLAQKSPVGDRYSATKGGLPLTENYSNSKPKKIVETTIYYED